MSSVSFHNADVSFLLKNKKPLNLFITTMFRQEGKSLHTLDIIFCSDNYLLSLNNQFLNHDYFTDILTFDLSVSNAVTSEIYISIDRVKENSELHGVNMQTEITRIILHGILHLCGFDDKSNAAKKQMTIKEDYYLAEFSMFHVKQ